MVSKPSNKRGRPTRFVRDNEGKEIYGLSQSKSDGRFYATFSKPRQWFGKDYFSALVSFHEWQAKQKGETIEITDNVPVVLQISKNKRGVST